MTKAVLCPHCGGENFGTKIKCHHCGELLTEVPVMAEDRHASPEEARNKHSPPVDVPDKAVSKAEVEGKAVSKADVEDKAESRVEKAVSKAEVEDKHASVVKPPRGAGGKMLADEFTLETGQTVNDITDKVRTFAEATKISGLVNIFLPHATAGVALMETGSGSEEDLEQVLSRLAPADNRYTHHHGSKGHGRDHLIPVFISPSLSIPVDVGKIVLGEWQSIVVIDSNLDNAERRVRLSFIPGEIAGA